MIGRLVWLFIGVLMISYGVEDGSTLAGGDDPVSVPCSDPDLFRLRGRVVSLGDCWMTIGDSIHVDSSYYAPLRTTPDRTGTVVGLVELAGETEKTAKLLHEGRVSAELPAFAPALQQIDGRIAPDRKLAHGYGLPLEVRWVEVHPGSPITLMRVVALLGGGVLALSASAWSLGAAFLRARRLRQRESSATREFRAVDADRLAEPIVAEGPSDLDGLKSFGRWALYLVLGFPLFLLCFLGVVQTATGESSWIVGVAAVAAFGAVLALSPGRPRTWNRRLYGAVIVTSLLAAHFVAWIVVIVMHGASTERLATLAIDAALVAAGTRLVMQWERELRKKGALRGPAWFESPRPTTNLLLFASSRFIYGLASAAQLVGGRVPFSESLLAPLQLASRAIDRRRRSMNSRTAREIQSRDPRPPVLLLRSFEDDGRHGDGEGGHFRHGFLTFEEIIVGALQMRGPVIAIGRPGERVPSVGAAREYLSHDIWQQRVGALMRDASLIVLVVGTTPGLAWELARVRELNLLDKLLIVLPNVDEDEVRKRMVILCAALGDDSDLADLLMARLSPAALVLWVEKGRAHVCLAADRQRASYERALALSIAHVPDPLGRGA